MPRYLASTARTAIRKPTARDEAEFVAAARASEQLHHPWVVSARTPETYAAYLKRVRQRNNFGVLVVDRTDPAGDRLAGWINLNQIVHGALRSAYAGYAAFAAAAGRGHMTTGLRLLTRYVFDEMGLHRLEANMQPGNAPSRELARRCGFVQEGFSTNYLFVDGAWRDHERWAITREMLPPDPATND